MKKYEHKTSYKYINHQGQKIFIDFQKMTSDENLDFNMEICECFSVSGMNFHIVLFFSFDYVYNEYYLSESDLGEIVETRADYFLTALVGANDYDLSDPEFKTGLINFPLHQKQLILKIANEKFYKSELKKS